MSGPWDLRPVIERIEASVRRHNLGRVGAYRRYTLAGKDHSLNPYGCADAANILYTIGRFPSDPAERAQWVDVLQGMQNPETGLFHEETHHDYHCTAHCAAAIELFDARPKFPLKGLHHLLAPGALESFLDGLDWKINPWPTSHQGAGAFAALIIAGEANLAWQDRYFAWLEKEMDPATGMWRKGFVPAAGRDKVKEMFPHMAGTFHYLFNTEYARRPIRYPDKMINTCLRIFDENLWPELGTLVNFAEIDWVYCVNRASRQTSYRYDDTRRAIREFAERFFNFMMNVDLEKQERADDIHLLFGSVCCIAELQSALPGMVRTEIPLKLVLDRRPFI